MTEGDRELLDLAAKAAGYEMRWLALPIGQLPEIHVPADRWERWNPLIDDGDALRLAVALDMAVSVESYLGSTAVLWGSPTSTHREPHGNGAMAATRRAIVHAAAEIGREMK